MNLNFDKILYIPDMCVKNKYCNIYFALFQSVETFKFVFFREYIWTSEQTTALKVTSQGAASSCGADTTELPNQAAPIF